MYSIHSYTNTHKFEKEEKFLFSYSRIINKIFLMLLVGLCGVYKDLEIINVFDVINKTKRILDSKAIYLKALVIASDILANGNIFTLFVCVR